MKWFGRKKEAPLEPVQAPVLPDIDVLLTEVASDRVTLQSRRTYPLATWLYVNVTSPSIENVRSTGLEICLEEVRKVGRTTLAYRGRLRNTTPQLTEWLQQVRDQGPPTVANAEAYVSLHLDQRLEPRSRRQFQVMSPDIPGYKAITSDVSRSGLRLQVPEALAAGARLRLTLRFDDFAYEDVSVTAEVLWTTARTNDHLAGVRFIDLTDAARDTIGAYLDFADSYTKKRFRGA